MTTTTLEGNPAIRWECTGEEYHADPSLGQSSLKLFLTDPEQYHAEHVAHSALPREATASQQFGLDLERLIFFGETPGVLIPDNVLAPSNRNGKVILSKRGDAWEQFKAETIAEHGPDVRMMRVGEWQEKVVPLLMARDQLRQHEKANALLYGDGEVHVAFRWTDSRTGIACKAQLDFLSTCSSVPLAGDLKTAMAVHASAFKRAVNNFGYHVQGWWYREAVRQWCGETLPFVFVVIKNKPSYSVETYELDASWLDLAETKVRRGLDLLAEARESNTWHTPTHGRIIKLDPPKWAFYEE
jgi:hypothetical protein